MLLFKNSTFKKLYPAKLLSLFGSGICTIALILLIYQLNNKDSSKVDFLSIGFGSQLGLLFAVQIGAKILGTPFMSAISAHFSEKTFLISMDLIRAACLVILIFNQSVFLIYILIFVITLCTSGFTPLYNTILPHIFDNEETYTQALSYTRMAEDLQRFISPLVAIILLLFFAPRYLFILTIIGFILSSVLVAFSKLPTISPTKSNQIEYSSWHACAIYIKNKRLRFVLLASFVSSLLGATIIINSSVFSIDAFHLDASFMVYLFTAYGFGSTIMALSITSLKKYISIQLIIKIGVILGLGTTLIAALLPESWVLLCVYFILFGLAAAMIDTLINYIVNSEATVNNRRSLFSANFSLTHIGWLFSYLIAGSLSDVVSMTSYFYILAGLIMFIFVTLICNGFVVVRKDVNCFTN